MRRPGNNLYLLILFLFTTAVAAETVTPEATLLENAYRAMMSGDYSSAAEGYRTALEANPTSVSAWQGLMQSQIALQDWNAAAVSGAEALSQTTDVPVIQRLYAWALFNLKEYSASLSQYTAAMDTAGENAEDLTGIGWCRFYLGQYRLADDAFSNAVTLSSDYQPAIDGKKALLAHYLKLEGSYAQGTAVDDDISGYLEWTHGFTFLWLMADLFHDDQTHRDQYSVGAGARLWSYDLASQFHIRTLEIDWMTDDIDDAWIWQGQLGRHLPAGAMDLSITAGGWWSWYPDLSTYGAFTEMSLTARTAGISVTLFQNYLDDVEPGRDRTRHAAQVSVFYKPHPSFTITLEDHFGDRDYLLYPDGSLIDTEDAPTRQWVLRLCHEEGRFSRKIGFKYYPNEENFLFYTSLGMRIDL